jgi:hypothetical protein
MFLPALTIYLSFTDDSREVGKRIRQAGLRTVCPDTVETSDGGAVIRVACANQNEQI